MQSTDSTPATASTDLRIDRRVAYDAPDGTTLTANVFRPVTDDSVPALLQRTPYGAPDVPTDPFATRALDAGFAVVIADTRGRGHSEGEFEPWVHERDDGARTVEWVAGRGWCSGRVGMYGGSSAATTQLMAAAERPEGLAAIAPQFAPSDIHGSDFFQDGAMSALTLVSWTFGWIAPHTATRLARDGTLSDATRRDVQEACYDALEGIPALARHRPLTELPAHVFRDVDLPAHVTPNDLAPHWNRWLSHPEYDEFWASFDAERLYGEMDVPGLHVTGWHDLCQHGTVTNYRGMREATDRPQFFVAGPWSHQNQSDLVGEVDFGPRAAADAYDWVETKLEFFRTYLTGADTRFAGTSGFAETFAMSPEGGEWVDRADWPPQDAAETVWHLDATAGSRDLTRTPPADEHAVSYVHDPTDPVPTRGGPLCCRDATREPGMFEHDRFPDRDDVVAFTSAPLEERVELAGSVELTVDVESDAPETDVTAKLLHVADDAAYNLCDGIRRVDTSEGVARATVPLWDVHHVADAGDRLQVRIASSNSPRFDPHPGVTDPWSATPDDVRSARQTLHLSADAALRLTHR